MEIHPKFRVGIDVGTNSVGLAAIEIDDREMPVRILNSVVYIHDSGVDPDKKKRAETRLATAGVARRTRRLVQRRRKRLDALDRELRSLGWPTEAPLQSDPFYPWKVRADLATERLSGDEQLLSLSVAIRHIARHRGWRSPYVNVTSLHLTEPDSAEFTAVRKRVSEFSGVVFDGSETPAQVVCETGMLPGMRIRSAPGKVYGEHSLWDGESLTGKAKEGILSGKLRQSDNANEIRRIGLIQGLDDSLVNRLIDLVFASESPKGKAAERAGKDSLPGQTSLPRAPKAHLAFQEFRILSFVANIRIYDPESQTRRVLTLKERDAVCEFLMNTSSKDLVAWEDIADVLMMDRNLLYGVASRDDGSERVSANPPINVTNDRILKSTVKPLVSWWQGEHSKVERQALVTALSNAEILKETEPGAEEARELLAGLDDADLERLEGITLPAGRAAYSVDSLRRMNKRMREDGVDMFDARRAEFGVTDGWQPDADPIGTPVGNPAVDRVVKIVNRWLMAVESTWGTPQSVNIEHVRSAFGSEAQAREYERETGRRHVQNHRALQDAREKLGIHGELRRSDTNRVLALQRQNCQCAYCGTPIDFHTAEMDHIVPRKGPGSSNQRSNLVAVCQRCNRAKSNMPFATWAESSGVIGVSLRGALERVRQWNDDPSLDRIQNRNYRRDVISRLKKTSEDEPIDARSIESVAWMAVELRHRIEAYYRRHGQSNVVVGVYRGAITAEARRSTGFEGKVQLLGGHGKTRLDRRHHAMDAAVIAMMKPGIAQVLAERDSLRNSQRISQELETWKDYWGTRGSTAVGEWRNGMNLLVVLFNDALAQDAIPVTQNIRLRRGSGEAHDATIQKLNRKKVADSWSITEIDRAESPQLWCALTRLPDFSASDGLPENQSREIRVRGSWLDGYANVGVFKSGAAAIAVRGGYAEIGSTIHHARIYRLPGKRPTYGMVRVFGCDLIRARNGDLFSLDLPPQSISMRTAEPKVRRALLDGEAEYLGWLVVGDELLIRFEDGAFTTGAIGEFISDFPVVESWKVDGFSDPAKLRLRPTMLAAEGLKNSPTAVSGGTVSILEKQGWRPSVNQLLSKSHITVSRRDALGRERWSSQSGLPHCLDLS